MSTKFNPLVFEGFDIVSGGATGPATRFYNTFNSTTDWTLNSPDYTYTVTAATHSRGVNPAVMVFELIGSDYELVQTNVIVNASGDVTIKVSETPDTRFEGLILLI